MRYIRLITGNKNKASDYTAFVKKHISTIEFLPLDISLPELQEENLETLMRAKVEVAKNISNLPFCVDDASFWSLRYPGFPGNFTKFVNSTIGISGLKRLFNEGDGITAIARIALHVNKKTFIFEGRIEGTMTFKNINEINPKMPMSALFLVNETKKTLGDSMNDITFLTHRERAIREMVKFLETENSVYKELPCE